MRGVSWATPTAVMTTVAPAYAASCTSTFTAALRTSSYTATSTTSGSGTATPSTSGAQSLTYTVSSVPVAGETLNVANLQPAGSSNVNPLGPVLRADSMQLQQKGALGGQTVTFTFPVSVTNLKLTIADIDTATGSYQDLVGFSVAPTTVAKGSAVTGSGTYSDPFKAIAAGSVNSDTVANQITASFAGPLTALSIRFSSGSGTSDQQIFLSGLSFTASSTC